MIKYRACQRWSSEFRPAASKHQAVAQVRTCGIAGIIARKDEFKDGKVRSLWQNHNLRSQPLLLYAGHQPQVQAEFAKSDRHRKGAQVPTDALHQVHSHDGENGVSHMPVSTGSLISSLTSFCQKSRQAPRFSFGLQVAQSWQTTGTFGSLHCSQASLTKDFSRKCTNRADVGSFGAGRECEDGISIEHGMCRANYPC